MPALLLIWILARRFPRLFDSIFMLTGKCSPLAAPSLGVAVYADVFVSRFNGAVFLIDNR